MLIQPRSTTSVRFINIAIAAAFVGIGPTLIVIVIVRTVTVIVVAITAASPAISATSTASAASTATSTPIVATSLLELFDNGKSPLTEEGVFTFSESAERVTNVNPIPFRARRSRVSRSVPFADSTRVRTRSVDTGRVDLSHTGSDELYR